MDRRRVRPQRPREQREELREEGCERIMLLLGLLFVFVLGFFSTFLELDQFFCSWEGAEWSLMGLKASPKALVSFAKC